MCCAPSETTAGAGLANQTMAVFPVVQFFLFFRFDEQPKVYVFLKFLVRADQTGFALFCLAMEMLLHADFLACVPALCTSL
jgi:hypothetical protein